MALQHRGSVAIEFLFEGAYDAGMIVSYVMHAVAGIEIENPSPIFSEQFGTEAARITHVHSEDVEQTHPLRIDALFVQRLWRR